jgi:dihydrofolate reductase
VAELDGAHRRPIQRITELISQPGKRIVLTGSISLAHALIAGYVVDEYRLFVYPTVQGRGRRLFPDGPATPFDAADLY